MGGPSSAYGERRGAYRSLLEKPEGKKPLVRPVIRWKDMIKTDLQEIEWAIYTANYRNRCDLF
jgi:hypothetical protein